MFLEIASTSSLLTLELFSVVEVPPKTSASRACDGIAYLCNSVLLGRSWWVEEDTLLGGARPFISEICSGLIGLCLSFGIPELGCEVYSKPVDIPGRGCVSRLNRECF